jgi:hypothetical protein
MSISVFLACPIFFISISPGVTPPGVFNNFEKIKLKTEKLPFRI